jgi:hypothetical protein
MTLMNRELSNILKFVSFVGLGLTVVPAFLVFDGVIEWKAHVTLMLIGTLLWFVTAPFGMNPKKTT